jgi:opacity protein-like surface antigen
MRLHWLLLVCSTVVSAQSFEASITGGQTVIPAKNKVLGTYTSDPASGDVWADGGFRLNLRMTLNQWRFFGHEFGYSYTHASVQLPASSLAGGGIGIGPVQPIGVTTNLPANVISMPAHQGYYDFLAYAAPEGFRVRPFVAAGVQFTAFSQPSSYYYSRETKYGVNYGGGLKIKVLENWGIRFDVRQYNMGKPFSLPNASGRFIMWEFGGGISFLM